MEKEKSIIVGQDIKDIDGEPQVRHLMAAFMVLKDDKGEKKEVNMRKVVGSKEKKNKENGGEK